LRQNLLYEFRWSRFADDAFVILRIQNMRHNLHFAFFSTLTAS